MSTSKDRHIRLMDLLAGWADFCHTETANGVSWAEPKVAARVWDLYTRVGACETVSDVEFGLFMAEILEILGQ